MLTFKDLQVISDKATKEKEKTVKRIENNTVEKQKLFFSALKTEFNKQLENDLKKLIEYRVIYHKGDKKFDDWITFECKVPSFPVDENKIFDSHFYLYNYSYTDFLVTLVKDLVAQYEIENPLGIKYKEVRYDSDNKEIRFSLSLKKFPVSNLDDEN